MACVLISRNLICLNKTNKINKLQQLREFKSALQIKWIRPEKIPCINPKQSGDLMPLGTLDLSQFPSSYKPSTELQSADENVRKINTLEFFPRQVHKEEFILQYCNRVKSHNLDDDSPEVKLAKITVVIRNLQIHMENNPRDKVNKVRLKETIERRNKMIERLRHSDFKKYEWILEKLDLQHKVFKFGTDERVERRKSLRRLTMLYVEKLKSERLQEYKMFLESQKEGFLKEKLEKLMWMKQTEEECGATPTITDADIKTVQKQLQDLQVVKPKEITE